MFDHHADFICVGSQNDTERALAFRRVGCTFQADYISHTVSPYFITRAFQYFLNHILDVVFVARDSRCVAYFLKQCAVHDSSRCFGVKLTCSNGRL
jgi:hypothetical protein